MPPDLFSLSPSKRTNERTTVCPSVRLSVRSSSSFRRRNNNESNEAKSQRRRYVRSQPSRNIRHRRRRRCRKMQGEISLPALFLVGRFRSENCDPSLAACMRDEEKAPLFLFLPFFSVASLPSSLLISSSLSLHFPSSHSRVSCCRYRARQYIRVRALSPRIQTSV